MKVAALPSTRLSRASTVLWPPPTPCPASVPRFRVPPLYASLPGGAYDAVIERVFVIHVDAFDWNCTQHITPRFTEEQIRESLTPIEKRMKALEQENERLRGEVARLKSI